MNRANLATVFAVLALVGRALRAADVVSDDRVVELPPVLVDESVKPRPWLYVSIPGVVVLSRCSESTTLEFIRGQYRAEQLLNFILPESLRGQFSLPHLIYLSTQEQTASAQQMLLKDGGSAQNPAAHGDTLTGSEIMQLVGNQRRVMGVSPRNQPPPQIRFLSNLRLEDKDETATFVMIDERTFDGNAIKVSEGAMRYLMDRHVPALPAWLRAGIDQFYRGVAFNSDDVAVGSILWTSPAERAAILNDRFYPRELFPLGELFASEGPSDDDKTDRANRWRAQAGLFVRWGLFGGSPARTATFWKFAERAAATGTTEALVREYFQLGYADLRDTLSDFLASPFADAGWKFTAKIDRIPGLKVRPATPEEITTLRGEWERLEADYVAESHPDFLQSYQERAESDLGSAYRSGVRDPGFLSTYGLFLADTGNRELAAPILEEAVRSPDARPRALLEASRLRFEAALKEPGGDPGYLSAEQVARVLELTPRLRQLQPAMPETYQLIVAVWASAGKKPSATDATIVEEGLASFPGDPVLRALHAAITR